MNKSVLVVGGGIGGIQAALDIASCGIEVILLEQSPSLQTEMGEESLLLRPKLLEAASHPHIRILTGVDIKGVNGKKGSLRVKVLQHPRYVKLEACTSCGRCEQACPVKLSSRSGADAHKAVRRPGSGLKSVPSTCIIDKKGVPPCNAACPAGVNVQGYVSLISKGRLKEALALVREAVPFPHILGRVCTHPCESACTRGKVDQPIGIASLKRYIADMEPSQYTLFSPEELPPTSKGRVAIIGAGPAGLTCARDLVRLGHIPTIFEALPVAGGMIAVGMPRFRLPREVREAEISAITKLGIEIKTSTPIGKDLTLTDLGKQGYEAIFIATGAHKNPKLDIPGEELKGVIDSIAFLRAINLKQPVNIGRNVVIIGGGYTAIDSARTAIRLHCDKVRVLYRRTEEEMAATPAEILETKEEGVEIRLLVAPTRIIGEDGKVVGVECQRMKLGGLDKTGRRKPIPIKGSEFIMEADTVIPAIGQLPDLDVFAHDTEIRIDSDGNALVVDHLTLSTNVPGIFAGGDVVYGPESMVEAVAAGRRAAVSIDRYLKGEDMRAGRTLESVKPVEVNLSEIAIPPGERRRIPRLPIKERVKNFEEVETGYTTSIALREAKRCLNCGGCSECMECVRTCELAAVDHSMQLQETEIEAGVVIFAANPGGAVSPELLKVPSASGVYILDSGSKDGDVTQRLMRASAVASKVIAGLGEYRSNTHTPTVPFLKRGTQGESHLKGTPIIKPRIGVFICRCGGGISDAIDVSRLVQYFFRRDGVIYAHEIGYACSDEGALEIRDVAKQNNLTHVVLAACPCCALDQICSSCSDRRMECKAKLIGPSQADGLCYEFVNIREHCAWVHTGEREKALEKAKALILAGIARVGENQPQETKALEIRRAVVVLGGGFSGLQAAVDLAAQGFQITLISNAQSLKGKEAEKVAVRFREELRQNGGMILEGAQLEDVQGSVGDYRILVDHQGKLLSLNAGAIVVDLGAVGSKRLPEIIASAVSTGQRGLDRATSRIPGVFLCGIGSAKTDVGIALAQGSAAASKASALLRKGEVQLVQTVATVDPCLCRGCGTCMKVCEFGAPSLIEKSAGVFISKIDETICRGCGTCVARCPSCAITQSGLSDCQITAALEAMLIAG